MGRWAGMTGKGDEGDDGDGFPTNPYGISVIGSFRETRHHRHHRHHWVSHAGTSDCPLPYHHRDGLPRSLSLQNHTRHAMPMQAIGRTRLVRNDVAVHVWTNVPVPGGEGGHTNRRLHTNHHPSSVGVDLPDSLPTPMLGWVARAGGDGRDR